MFLISLLAIFANFWILNAKESPPHIIFIYADDLGWNDVSYHGSPEIPTPNIDALGLSGITLHNYYGHWLCTPSRGSFLTGKYAIHLGLQHNAILVAENSGLPFGMVTLPEHLKKLGYATHMVGKWHLGYSMKEDTPTYKGFDTFLGYYNSFIDYYDYTYMGNTELEQTPFFYGSDLHNNTREEMRDLRSFRSKYATTLFTERAVDIIGVHNSSQPLFLYLAHLAVHAGHRTDQLGIAPPEYIRRFMYIKDFNRRVQAARTAALDDSVGTVISALDRAGLLDNSIIIFASDNGGEVDPSKGGFSSNYPLRGRKHSVWEGGFRLPAIVFSPLLKLKEQKVYDQLMHVTDWLPTFYSAAGGNVADLGEIDGHDMWSTLLKNSPSPRTNVLYNVDRRYGVSAYKDGDLKIVNGTVPFGFDHWYGRTGFEDLSPPNSMYDWVFRAGSEARDVLHNRGYWVAKDPDQWYNRNTVLCAKPTVPRACDPAIRPCLFNVTADPCEYYDLSRQMPSEVERLMTQIYYYDDISAKSQAKKSDPRGNPLCYDFAYIPFYGTEAMKSCNISDH